MHAERTEESERGLVGALRLTKYLATLFSAKKVADTLSSFAEALFPICSQLVLGFYLLASILEWWWRCGGLRRHHSMSSKLCMFFVHENVRVSFFIASSVGLLIPRGGDGTAPMNFSVRSFTLTYLQNCVPLWQRWKFIAYKLSHHSRWQSSQCIPC